MPDLANRQTELPYWRPPMATKKERGEAKVVRRDLQSAQAELEAEWDRRLAPLQTRDARKRLETALAAKGRTKRRSSAGSTFGALSNA